MLNIKYRFLILYIKLVVVKVIKVGGAILKNEGKRDNVYHYIFGKCQKDKIVLVCSAIGRNLDPYSTDGLLNSVNHNLTLQEEDRLKAIGETYSVLKVTSDLRNLKIHVKSFSYIELGLIIQDNKKWFNSKKIKKYLKIEDILVVPGFIGRDKNKEPVTLKREGSDLSAAIIASSLNLKVFYLFKDMPGLCDKEGNIYNEISFDDFFKFTKDFSSPISKECVLFAQKHKMNIICINTDGQKVLTISF